MFNLVHTLAPVPLLPLPAALTKMLAKIPSAVFAPSVAGQASYSLAQRLSCLLIKFCEYSLAGMACGLVGQAIANAAMEAK